MQGEHCVVWKPSRHLAESKGTNDQNVGRLYPYSSDFPKHDGIQHAGIPLEIDADTTGRFYRSSATSDFINDFAVLDIESLGAEFMVHKEGLLKVCLARFTMPEADGGQFAVSIYRRRDQADFTLSDAAKLQVLAGFLPILYQKLISAQLREAVGRVNVVLRPRCQSVKDARKPLTDLSKLLADFFNIVEVSVFLQDPFAGERGFDCFASTVMEQLDKTSYQDSEGDGLTGYVLATKKPIWFHDLHNFLDQDVLKVIHSRHGGIKCTDGAGFARLALKMFSLPKDAHPPPLSFLAVPILEEDGSIVGALRASLGINPFHFLDEQIKVFTIIAAEIGRWWGAIIHSVTQERRGDVWEAVNKSMAAQQDYLRGSDDMDGLCQTIVASIAGQPGFDLACFRRGRIPRSLELSALEYSAPEASRRGVKTKNEKGATIPLGFPLETPHHIRGFSIPFVERTIADVAAHGSFEEQSLFSGLARVLSFPVFIKTRLYGVLDIGIHDDRVYLPASSRIKEYGAILARQLALFERITESIDDVEKAQKNEIKTYAAVTHQLKTPLFTASRRLRELNARQPGVWTPDEEKMLLKASGMVRKARSVTNMIETLGKIVANEQVKPRRLIKIYPQDARKVCLEVAQNALTLVDERMKTNFDMKPEVWGFALTFRWDYDFAEQCLDAVINNAFKYSGHSRRITIQGQPEGSEYAIRVTNRGPFHIASHEAALCTDPYWRGNKAREREGAGIGLWIASVLMKAQGGELRVHPTNVISEETTIELRFA